MYIVYFVLIDNNIILWLFFRRFGSLQYDGGGRCNGPELGGSVRLFGGRSQWYQPAGWRVRQRPTVAGLDATENRRACALGCQAVRHISHTSGFQWMRVQNTRQVSQHTYYHALINRWYIYGEPFFYSHVLKSRDLIW